MDIKHFHRRRLPHLYYNQGIYFVTYRLYGSIPQNRLDELQNEIDSTDDEAQKRVFKKYDMILDKTENQVLHLRNPKIAEACKKSIMFFDKKDINVICYCIMPNHVHLAFDLLSKVKLVGEIMASIKRYSAKSSNEILNSKGKFWQAESFDRLVRDEKELYNIIKYVLLNPVNAGLVKDYKDWQHTYCKKEYLVL
ncbi:MAG: transposase [Ignavibacteria bacterium]|nr:transposase [Ignavibacteria bacterium]